MKLQAKPLPFKPLSFAHTTPYEGKKKFEDEQ